jgi:DUF3047 family protein
VRSVAAALLFAAASLAAAGAASIAAFSAARPGDRMPPDWRAAIPPRARSPQFALVDDAGTTVLRVRSDSAAGTLAHSLRVESQSLPALAWRWKIDRVVAKADLETRQGDDFAARVYVFFDLPESELSFAERATLALARLVHGQPLPAAGICYVWDNRHARGTAAWNPYWQRIRMVVLESGGELAGKWVDERRDLRADFVAAFGARDGKPVPAVTGIAVGNDTDQTRESATAWFGDVRIEAAR